MTLIARFMTKVKIKHGCWVWTGSLRRDGYGRFRLNGKTLLAHRVAFQLFKNNLSRQLDVCHTCDNPSCVNPGHLVQATHTWNMQDKISKNRDHNLRKKKCKRGHIYSKENTYRAPGSSGRHCRKCRVMADRRRRK